MIRLGAPRSAISRSLFFKTLSILSHLLSNFLDFASVTLEKHFRTSKQFYSTKKVTTQHIKLMEV